MLFREGIAIDYSDCMKHTNTVRGRNVELGMLNMWRIQWRQYFKRDMA